MLKKMLKRTLPLVVKSLRHCNECQHFDLEAGQREMQKHPLFMAVAQHVTPDRIGKSVFRPRKENESDEDYRAAHDAAREELSKQERGIEWTDIGLCSAREELRWRKDACDKWSARSFTQWLDEDA